MRSDPLPPKPGTHPPGFTLIEIMAVMAVIAVLLSVAAVGVQSIEKGQATTSALAVTEALFDEARSTAVGRGTRARLLIHADLNDSDPADRQRYLSYMCVATLQTDNDGNPTNTWKVLTRGTQLPGGVYFSPEQTKEAERKVQEIGTYGTMNIELPGKTASSKCFYYEFNAEGICVDGDLGSADDVNAGAVVVLVSGARPMDQPEPIVRKDNKVGFVVWRRGTTSIFRSPKQFN